MGVSGNRSPWHDFTSVPESQRISCLQAPGFALFAWKPLAGKKMNKQTSRGPCMIPSAAGCRGDAASAHGDRPAARSLVLRAAAHPRGGRRSPPELLFCPYRTAMTRARRAASPTGPAAAPMRSMRSQVPEPCTAPPTKPRPGPRKREWPCAPRALPLGRGAASAGASPQLCAVPSPLGLGTRRETRGGSRPHAAAAP